MAEEVGNLQDDMRKFHEMRPDEVMQYIEERYSKIEDPVVRELLAAILTGWSRIRDRGEQP